MTNDPRLYAFPCETPPACSDGQSIPFGLTKRELFAAMAMQAIIGKTPSAEEDRGCSPLVTMTADGAVDYADALLAVLDVTNKETQK